MTSSNRSVGIYALQLVAILAAVGLVPQAASADGGDDTKASVPGITLGGRAVYDRPGGASEGTLGGGLQFRAHLTSVIAVEASADMRQNTFGGETVDTFPLQASLMAYLAPHFFVSPYVLGGVGWYYTHVRGSSSSPTNRYGPHAGFGAEIALAQHWTVDGSYRYLWNQSLTIPTKSAPFGQNFSDNGFMLTAGLNYRF